MAKKSFMNTDNPAMQFISAPAPKPGAALPETHPEEAAVHEAQTPPVQQKDIADIYFIPPRSAEHKSKRAQLLMTPSLHEKVAKKAASLNMSFNELVNLLLEKYVQ